MKKSKLVIYVLLAVFLVVFCCSAAYVIHYLTQSREQKELFEELADIVSDIRSGELSEVPNLPSENYGVSTQPSQSDGDLTMLPEYAALYEVNSDIVGWIKIDGTVIDYPVMQTPDQVDYYLKRSFYGRVSSQGCIYVREECDVLAPSDNLTIYGHHMRDGSMFAALSSYTQSSFWQEHSRIRFDTLYEYHDYQIFAVFETTASEGEGFPYHQFVDAQNEEEFDAFVAECKVLALYDTGFTPQYGDKLICLSTCDYSRSNGRLVVAAYRMD